MRDFATPRGSRLHLHRVPRIIRPTSRHFFGPWNRPRGRSLPSKLP
ncbi:hypothetical protein RSAG8_05470, partial [Rhizoctonia solani AG-8 WAC10335]